MRAEKKVYNDFRQLVRRVSRRSCFDDDNLDIDWADVNEKVLAKLSVCVDGEIERVLRFAMEDFPMNESTSIDWRHITLDVYAHILGKIKSMNIPAVVSFVVNRNQKLQESVDGLNQQTLNASRGLASSWNHNFVCSCFVV